MNAKQEGPAGGPVPSPVACPGSREAQPAGDSTAPAAAPQVDPAALSGPVSHYAARMALDDMDDYARMSCGVDAVGARETLKRYINEQEGGYSPASTEPAMTSEQYVAHQEPSDWQHPAGAPPSDMVLLLARADDGSTKTFVAQQSYNAYSGATKWFITVGWEGWTLLHPGYTPIGWKPLPE